MRPVVSLAPDRIACSFSHARVVVIRKISPLLKNSISGFIADSALSHAAAIAYFTIFAIGPLLIIIIAVAGLVFGADAVRHAIVDQFSGLMGSKSGEAIQTAIQGVDAGRNAKSVWARFSLRSVAPLAKSNQR